jgi:hypothetical protein
MGNQEEELISLKDVILKIQEYIRYLFRRSIPILIFAGIVAGFMVFNAIKQPGEFEASRKFFVEGKGTKGGLGGLGGLLGSIGVSQGKSNPFQLLEVANSKIVVSEILLTKIGDDQDYLGNKIIEAYNLNEIWNEKNEDGEDIVDYRFSHDSIASFTRKETITLKRLMVKMISSDNEPALREVGLEEDKGYYFINAKTVSHEISLAIEELTYEKVRIYFEEKTMRSYIDNRDILKEKSDSIQTVLKAKLYELARFEDRNRNSISAESKVRERLLETEISLNASAAVELAKNYELADYTLRSQRPIFMLIDRSMPPLSYIRTMWWVVLIRGFILGSLLGVGFFIVRKVYTDIMNDTNKENA